MLVGHCKICAHRSLGCAALLLYVGVKQLLVVCTAFVDFLDHRDAEDAVNRLNGGLGSRRVGHRGL